MANLIKFKGPAPELIKIALATGTEATFFGAAPTYTPIYFDSELLEATYGNQIFLDTDAQKNFVWLSEAVSGECLNDMNDFVNNTVVLELGDVPGVDVEGTFIPDSKTVIK